MGEGSIAQVKLLQAMDELMLGSGKADKKLPAYKAPRVSSDDTEAPAAAPATGPTVAAAPPTHCCNAGPRTRFSPCANELWTKKLTMYRVCAKKGEHTCPSCELVEYCSEKCRFEHLEDHAPFCTPKFASKHWKPDLRAPERKTRKGVVEPSPGIVMWGGGPAYDILAPAYRDIYLQDINILWPVSGDLRNTVLTVTHLPVLYDKTCDITLNDPDVSVVIRNALMLMITFLYPNKLEAAKTVMHLWYSAALKEVMWHKMKYELLPFVERAYAKNMRGRATSQVSQRWTKCNSSLRLTLTRRQWKQMLDILRGAGDNVDFFKAMESRRLVIDPPRQKIRTNKKIFDMPAEHRRAHVRYTSTGILSPFGQPIGEFNVMNPTLFSSDGKYLNSDANTPLEGWNLEDVLETGKKYDVLENDLYAALNQYIGSTLFDFCLRLSDLKHRVNFHLYSVETKKLDGTLGNNKLHHLNGLDFLQAGPYDEE